MAVTKRTRFEVLRRDNYTCRYCRSTEGQLHVDHVTPVALGGTDDPSNLVAACKDCNLGKASASPDAETVADVASDALRFAEVARQAYAALAGKLSEKHTYLDQVAHAIEFDVPDDWRATVGRWFQMGVPVELVIDAAQTAACNRGRFHGDGRFRYMCGVVWNIIRKTTEAAAAEHNLSPASPLECGHCTYCRYPQHREAGDECELLHAPHEDEETPACTVCGERACPYDLGVQDGMEHEWRRNHDAIMHYRTCKEVQGG